MTETRAAARLADGEAGCYSCNVAAQPLGCTATALELVPPQAAHARHSTRLLPA